MKRFVFVLTPLLFFAMPASSQKIVDEIIAIVNSDVILKSEYDEEAANLELQLSESLQGAQLAEAVEGGLPNLLRDMIDQNLLRQKAEEYGVDVSLDVIRTMEDLRQEYDFETLEDLEAAIVAQGDSPENYREMLRTRYMTEAVVNQEVYSSIIITNEEARKYYDANMEQFDRPAGIRLQEIVILRGKTPEDDEQARAAAEEALKRVREGEEFSSVAFEVSASRTAQAGGDLGFFENGQLSETYESAAAGLNRNQVSGVIDLPDAYIILKLLNGHSGGIMVFELAMQEIQNYLISLQAQDVLREYLTGLREQAFIHVKDGYVDTGAAEEG